MNVCYRLILSVRSFTVAGFMCLLRIFLSVTYFLSRGSDYDALKVRIRFSLKRIHKQGALVATNEKTKVMTRYL